MFERVQPARCGTMRNKTSVSHDEVMVKKLRARPRFAAEYLKATMEDSGEPEVLLIALRHVGEAAGIERESLYRTPSAAGLPGSM